MKHDTHAMALCAVLTALALALSYMEGMFPAPVPLPGFKLGLANIVTLFALYWLGAPSAFIILIARCLLGAMFAGNASALIFSIMGGLLALAVMALLSRFRRLSVYGVSIGGAAAHNTGQVFAAMLTLGTAAPMAYLPTLLVVALFTGALTGFITTLLFRAMRNTNMKPKREGL